MKTLNANEIEQVSGGLWPMEISLQLPNGVSVGTLEWHSDASYWFRQPGSYYSYAILHETAELLLSISVPTDIDFGYF